MPSSIKWILYFAIFFLFYALYGRLNGILELGYPSYGYNFSMYGFVVSFPLLLSFGIRRGNSLFYPFLLFTFIGVISCFLNYTDFASFIESIICISTPMSAYFIGIGISKMQLKSKENLIRLLCLVFFLLELLCVWALIIDPDSLMLNRDFVFCLLFFTPTVTIIKNKTFGILLFVIEVFIIMISIKRSAIIGVVISSLVFFIITLLFNRAMSFRKKMLSIIVALPLIFGSVKYYLNTDNADKVLERMESIDSDGGSGRDHIYTTIAEKIDDSDFLNYFFGHGYNAVSNEIFGHPAHNDLLEISYDFGIITLCAWLIIVGAIIFGAIRAVRHKTNYLGALYLSSFVLWQVVCETNCIILNAPYNATIFLIFGIISHDINGEKFKIPKGTNIVRSI